MSLGHAMRRAAAGASVWSPADLGDLYAWWDISDATTLTLGAGDFPTTVADKSGNGYDLAGVGSGALISADGTQNGLTSIQLKSHSAGYLIDDTTADWDWIPAGDYITVFWTGMIDAGAFGDEVQLALGTHTSGSSAGEGFGVLFDNRSTQSRSDVLGGQIATGDPGNLTEIYSDDNELGTIGNWQTWSLQMRAGTSGNQHEYWLAETSQKTGTDASGSTGAGADDGFAVGNRGTLTSLQWIGEVGEVIVCKSAAPLGSGDIAAAQSYLVTKWGTDN